MSKFFAIISSVDSLKALAEEVPLDPELPQFKTKRLYLELSGCRSEQKETILNLCFLHFVQNHKRSRRDRKISEVEKGMYDFEYQPDTFSMHLRTIFGALKNQGITYVLADFEKKGLFLSWLYDHWDKISKVRSDFGGLPHQAEFDPQMEEKIRNSISCGDLKYETDYKNFTMLIIVLLGKTAMLRGASEVRTYIALFFTKT